MTDAATITAHLADQNRHYTNNPRTEATPDWSDLNWEEQMIVDENRYLLENGGIAFGDDDEEEND